MAAPPADAHADAARAFAVLFTSEYLTWHSADPADHAARLRPYLRPGMDEQAGWSPGSAGADQTVLGAWVYAYSAPQPDQRLVTVAARAALGSGKGAPTERVLYLQVPVSVSSAGLAVYSLPAFVPGPALSSLPGPSYGTEVSDPPAEIRPLVTGFLKAYVSGSDAELAYFMPQGSRLSGLHGLMQWQGLSQLTVYRSGAGLVAVAEGTLLDPASGAPYHQRWRLQLEQGDRWYVKDVL